MATQDNILDAILDLAAKADRYVAQRDSIRGEAKTSLQSLLKQAELRGMKSEWKRIIEPRTAREKHPMQYPEGLNPDRYAKERLTDLESEPPKLKGEDSE